MTPQNEGAKVGVGRRFVIMFMTVGAACLIVACNGRGSEARAVAVTARPTPTVFSGLTIVAVGDSLTEGYGLALDDAYPAQLEDRLLDAGYAVRVVNAGNSGETSSGARSRLAWVMGLAPDIVILATGGNDGLRGIDPTLTTENIDAMVAELVERDVVVVLAGMEMVQNMGETYTTAFRAVYPDVAGRYDVIFVPFLLEGVAADPMLNQADFIHPNAAGQALMAETLLPYLVRAIKQVGP